VTSFLKLIGLLILGAVAVVAMIFLWVWFWLFIAGFFLFFLAIWACGTRFKITKTINGQKVTVGYLRWTTFYPIR
jgi:hypothetical protein